MSTRFVRLTSFDPDSETEGEFLANTADVSRVFPLEQRGARLRFIDGTEIWVTMSFRAITDLLTIEGYSEPQPVTSPTDAEDGDDLPF